MCMFQISEVFFFDATRVVSFFSFYKMLHNPLGINARLCQKETILYLFLYSFRKIHSISSCFFFPFHFCSPAAPCRFPFRSPVFLFFLICFLPFIYGRLLRGLFLLRLQHFLLASSRICAALLSSFYPSSNFLS